MTMAWLAQWHFSLIYLSSIDNCNSIIVVSSSSSSSSRSRSSSSSSSNSSSSTSSSTSSSSSSNSSSSSSNRSSSSSRSNSSSIRGSSRTPRLCIFVYYTWAVVFARRQVTLVQGVKRVSALGGRGRRHTCPPSPPLTFLSYLRSISCTCLRAYHYCPQFDNV